MQADVAAESIASGNIDAVAIGRQFICDGEYLTKLKEGREEDIRPCISCHNACLPVAYYKTQVIIIGFKRYRNTRTLCIKSSSFRRK